MPYAISAWAQARVDVRVRDRAEQARLEQAMAALARANRVPGTAIAVDGGFHRPPMVELPGARPLRRDDDAVSQGAGQCVEVRSAAAYFPIQNVLKIKFKISSAVVAPVISSSGRNAL